jgi:cytochrome c oxidase subunit 2
VPPIRIKIDANPGRLNSNLIEITSPGIFFGHCSEICGANHTFIPIVLEVIRFLNFKEWYLKKLIL